MNKLVKGSIAGAAGIALLLGGASTFALWNSSAAITDASISSGTLTVSASAGTWSTNPALWVPGDTFTYTSTLSVVANGTNLTSQLSVDSATITGGANLKAAIVTSMAVSGALPARVTLASPGVYNIAPAGVGGAAISIPVIVTVTFPSSISGTTAQTESVDLANLQFKLQQQ